MKIKIVSLIVFLCLATSITAQTTIDNWTAINDLQVVVTQTFHPAEEGNIEPLKSRSEELMNKANDLLQLDIPEEYRTKEILTLSENLLAKSKTLHALVVSKAFDEELLKAITEVHTVLHQIIGLCNEVKK